MIIAVSTSGENLSSPVDSRFGRAPRFLIFDSENGDFQLVDNMQNLNAAQGAGIQSAQNVINTGAKVLITGHTGPKAFGLLNAANVEIFNIENVTVEKALELYKSGKIAPSLSADVDSHW